METGTLKELNVKPGDVVEWIFLDGNAEGTPYSVQDVKEEVVHLSWQNDREGVHVARAYGRFRIVSRAVPTPDLTAITTPFGLLDEATQGALRAHGGPYEYWYSGEWIEGCNVGNLECWAWRVQPEPETETITCDAHIHPSGIISKIESDKPQPVRVTFNRINGVIDLASYKVQAR